ncbi:MAG: InlB B-repeat-containing protein, partial [Lachnospiraceae bacterium]|nr:InlB B-repeat-containing protein [Lachnospiraceae bacterium]
MDHYSASKRRRRQVLSVVLTIAMLFGSTVPVSADTPDTPAGQDGYIQTAVSEQAASASGGTAGEGAHDTQEGITDTPESGTGASGNGVSRDEVKPAEASENAAPEDSTSGNTVSGDSVSGDTVSEDSVSGDSVSEDSASGNEAEEPAGSEKWGEQYGLDAKLVADKDGYKYPGVYTVSVPSATEANQPNKKVNGKIEIGIPSISNKTLENTPTTESPAIIMGAAVPYEKKVGPTEFEKIDGGSLYAPYSYFRYQIIEEANLNGVGGVHKKMSGYDGSYVIIRLDVKDLVSGNDNGSYLHMQQKNNKALMVAIGQTVSDDHATFSNMGNMTGSYLISDNKLVMKDATGAYKEASYIDVCFMSSGTLVQGADTGAAPDPKAPSADFPINFYIDKVGDYEPQIEWNSSLGTAVDKETGKEITMTQEETKAGLTPTDRMLNKYFREASANQAGMISSNYLIKGSDIELEIQVDDGVAEPGKPDYWSLKKAMEYASYRSKPIKMICEAPLLKQISVTADKNNDVILDVYSFDIQLANHQSKNTAAITVNGGGTLNGAKLTIQDSFNTTGAELAVGNNAKLEIINGGRLVITDSAQLEVEYDAASVSAGDAKPDYESGVLVVRDGGVLQNDGIITVEGQEGKPRNAGEVIVRDYANAKLSIGKGGTLDNSGCLLVNGQFFNLGTVKNTGRYKDTITSNDPDKGTFTYHKGIQLSWKDDITQGHTYPGNFYNGLDDANVEHPEALLDNNGDIVMIPGYLDNHATIKNSASGNIYMCAVDEIVVPVSPHADAPLVTEQRVSLGEFEPSVLYSSTANSTIINDGFIGTAEIPVISNGRTGDIEEGKVSRGLDEINIYTSGTVENTGTISVNALHARNAVTNSANGIIRRIFLEEGLNNITGSFTDSSSNKNSKIYNGAKTENNGTNSWSFAGVNKLEFLKNTRRQSCMPGESVSWDLIAHTAAKGSNILYSIETGQVNGDGAGARYDVSADNVTQITSPSMDDIDGNEVFLLYAEGADTGDSSSIESASVKVSGSGFIRPTAMQGLSYNGQEQPLVTAGSITGRSSASGKVLYSLSKNDGYTDTVPTGKNAGSYTVYYRALKGDETISSGSIDVSIGKRAAYIAADDLFLQSDQVPTDRYVTHGILKEDLAGFNISVTKNGDNLTLSCDTSNTNYNITKFDGNYTKINAAVPLSANVQAVMRNYDPIVSSVVSINVTYKPEQAEGAPKKAATIYYSLSENLSEDNYKTKGTTIAPKFGGMGEQEMYYYVDTPDGGFSGSKTIVVTKGSQAAPKDLKVSDNFIVGLGGLITGIVPYNVEQLTAEYRRADETDYRRVTLSEKALFVPAGNYYVRYRGDIRFDPSPDFLVSVVENRTVSVKFDSRGGSSVSDATGLIYGDDIPKPEDPKKGGGMLDFVEWCTDEAATRGFDFDSHFINGYNDPAVLYAKWQFAVPGTDEEDAEELVRDIGETEIEVKTEKTGEGISTNTITLSGEKISVITTDADGKITVSSQLWVGGLSSDYIYTGAAIKPAIHVYDGVKKLTEKTDYSLSYKYNKNAAKLDAAKAPVIIVTFKGSYKGNAPQRITFTISPARLGEEIDVKGTAVVALKNNKEQEPAPLVLWSETGKTVNRKFYSVSYDRAVKEAGTYTAWVEAANDNYSGKVSADIIVSDKEHVLSKAKVTVRAARFSYKGQAVVLSGENLTVKMGSKTLAYGTDYTVDEFYDNVDPGKATMVLKAASGNESGYTGTKPVSFRIVTGRTLTNTEGSDFR